MNSIQLLSKRYDTLATFGSRPRSSTPSTPTLPYPPTPTATRRRPSRPPRGVRRLAPLRAFVALWSWVYTQWAVLVFVKKVVTGADLDLDDESESKHFNANGEAVNDLGNIAEEEEEFTHKTDTGSGLATNVLDASPHAMSRQRTTTISLTTHSGVTTNVPPPPSTSIISLNQEPSLSFSSLVRRTSSNRTLLDDDRNTSSDECSTIVTLEFTPPTPGRHSTPLPLPQTRLLNPSATSLLTTHPKSLRRRKDPSLNEAVPPRTLTPVPLRNLPKTLVLDLDETLIHSTSRAPSNYGSYGQGLFSAGGLGFGIGSGGIGFGIWGGRKTGPGHMVEVVLGGRSTLYHVYKRPFVDYFLKKNTPTL
ncbi:Nuclear envelope morphology protein 1 [Tulasnella sp. 403]|nr:Nuclear envelope morphology protein 1 [Tulasnella sp. 403]